MIRMDIIERMKRIIEVERLSVSSFARRLGVCDQTIRGIVVQRRNKPSFDLLSKIIETFPSINAEWLLTGRGKMLCSRQSVGRFEQIEIKELIEYLKEKDYKIEQLMQENMSLKSKRNSIV